MKPLCYISALILLISCKVSNPVSEDLNIEETPQLEIMIDLSSGTNGGFEDPTKKVIKTKEEFLQLWADAHRNLLPPPKAPEVDFEEYQVVIVAMGMRTSGGYSIKINSVNNSKGNLMISVTETSPGKGCMLTEALTFPFQMIQIKKNDGKVFFNVTEKVIDCESK